MASVRKERRQVNGKTMLAEALEVGQAALVAAVSQRLNELLIAAVTLILGRDFHVRRQQVSPEVEQVGRCHQCKSHQSRRFSRNGYRAREILTTLGWIPFFLPRLRCECGGSVELKLEGFLRPYQRISDHVDEQIQRWYRLGMSLRNLTEALEHSWMSPLSLGTLLTRVHQVAEQTTSPWPSEVPPIVQVDAIWVTLVLPTGGLYRDRKGRQRPRTGRFRRPILIALGIWPEAERTVVLDWMLANSEDEAEWTTFLSGLEAEGICGEGGLELVIHDGGSGLCAALRTVYFAAPTQRCLFHKLHNIARALHLPKGMTRRQRSRQRKAMLKHFQDIWQAKRYTTALRRYLKVFRHFRQSQPDAVASLRRDFRNTLAFYPLTSTYDRRFLRTTSHLERYNRTLRTQFSKANTYHSVQGLSAAVAQQVALFNA